MKKLLLALLLISCAPHAPTAPRQSCTLFKIGVDFAFLNGIYKSQFISPPLGNAAHVFIEIKSDSMRAWTETIYSTPAEPATGAEKFAEWFFDGSYLHLNSFMPLLYPADDSTFQINWMDTYLIMHLVSQPTTGIIEPQPPQPPKGCKE